MPRGPARSPAQVANVQERTLIPRVDPRLRFVFALFQRGDLSQLKAAETGRLRALDRRIRETREELAEAVRDQAEPQRIALIERELAALEGSVFAPITTGVHLADDATSSASRRAKLKEPFVSVIVRLEVPDRAIISSAGAQVRCGAGRLFTAYVPLSRLQALAGATGVESIELARPLFRNLGDAIEIAQIDALHAAGTKGAGVIVGVIDNWLDVYHEDFRNAAGTRVLFLWDQTLVTQGVEKGPPLDPALPGFTLGTDRTSTYGVEYSKANIDAEINGRLSFTGVRHKPEDLHGTAVTGCAAGNGRAWAAYRRQPGDPTQASLAGAAPEADIIFVRHGTIDGTSLLADSTDVLEAFAYVFARAKALGQACVVNLSDSDNQGPHDGTALGEQFLDELLAAQALRDPGRAITLSAGNSTGTYCHARGQVPGNSSITLDLDYWSFWTSLGMAEPTNSDAIEIWSPSGAPLEIQITAPTVPATVIPFFRPGRAVEAAVGDIQVIVTSVVGDSRNGDNLIQVLLVVPDGKTIPIGRWKLELRSSSRGALAFDAWIDRNNRGLAAWTWSAFRDEGERKVTLGVPSSAKGPITVGCHDKSDPAIVSTGWESSGRGPTRTNAHPKPDVSATGMVVLAPYPMNLPKTVGFPYKYVSGTSISAPIVAGACALLFQGNLNLTCDQIRGTLTTAGPPVLPPATASPDDGFGFGSIRM